jgi:hypothetical protein
VKSVKFIKIQDTPFFEEKTDGIASKLSRKTKISHHLNNEPKCSQSGFTASLRIDSDSNDMGSFGSRQLKKLNINQQEKL